MPIVRLRIDKDHSHPLLPLLTFLAHVAPMPSFARSESHDQLPDTCPRMTVRLFQLASYDYTFSSSKTHPSPQPPTLLAVVSPPY